MSRACVAVLIVSLLLAAGARVSAQQIASEQSGASSDAAVPTLVNFNGVLTDLNGKPLTGIVGVTFLLYKEQQGGAPLWLETQNVQPNKSGQYSVMLGSASSAGLPADMFASGEARWFGVRVQGQEEQPRIMLLSVPYAMKAGDAATIGGLPPSAFVLANSSGSNPSGSSPNPSNLNSSASQSPSSTSSSSDVTTTGGTVGTIAAFSTATNVQSSLLSQTGTTAINVGGKLNLPATGTATVSAGFNSRPHTFVASSYNSGTSAAVAQTFQLQAESAGNDTSTPSGTLNVLFSSGTTAPAETGLKISNTGLITFATGQTFPGTGSGTITGVTAGSGLTGGGTSGDISLSIPSAGIQNSMLANSSVTVAAGTALTGGGAVALGASTTLNLDTTKVPLLAASNTFTGNQTVNGNLSATGMLTGSGFQIGSNVFDYGNVSAANAFTGFAGNSSMTGSDNTATGVAALFSNTTGIANTANGFYALEANTTGYNNTANGDNALQDNTTGAQNTASGEWALEFNTTGSSNTALGGFAGFPSDFSNITGSNNTFLGFDTSMSTGTLTNATAIGANAQVTESNAMVLGSINGLHGATSNVNVGIGITAPAYGLDVYGTGHFTQAVTFGSPVNFASGQTFPGTGTITGITAGAGLSGGGSSGGITLTNTGVLSVAAGTGISVTSGQSPTVSLNTAQIPLLNANNTFTGSQTVNGNLIASGVVGAGGFSTSQYLGGLTTGFYLSTGPLFDYGDGLLYENAFTGYAGSPSVSLNGGGNNAGTGWEALENDATGSYNTADGSNALQSNTTGAFNTAAGGSALLYNTSGQGNTAIGYDAGLTSQGSSACVSGPQDDSGNTTGSYNTFVGCGAGPSSGNLTNATAIGFSAQVSQSNSLVLGSSGTNVGIGITAPTHMLHIGTANNAFRVEGPVAGTSKPILASFGGSGDFAIDAVGTVDGRFVVKDTSGYVGINTSAPDTYLSVNGGADKPGGGSWGTFSDRRLKNLDGGFTSGLSQIMHINPVRYRYKDDNGMGIRDTEEHVGLVAQDVQKVIPEAVTENRKGYLLVNNDPILWAMLNAVKEQQKMIEKLRRESRAQAAQMKAQQAMVVSLSSQINAIRSSLDLQARSPQENRDQRGRATKMKFSSGSTLNIQ
jgi:hypothetical protein